MKNTSKRAFTIFLCGVLAFMACACGSPAPAQPDSGANATGGAAQTALPLPAEQTAEAEQKEQQGFVEGSGTETESAMKTAEERYARPRLISPVFLLLKKKDIAAAVTESGIAKEFSNVINYKDFYLPEGGDKRLLEDGFFVSDPAGGEFFEVYESNRYFQTPSFITVDSLMHSYHLYFSYILKKTEIFLKSSMRPYFLQRIRKLQANGKRHLIGTWPTLQLPRHFWTLAILLLKTKNWTAWRPRLRRKSLSL